MGKILKGLAVLMIVLVVSFVVVYYVDPASINGVLNRFNSGEPATYLGISFASSVTSHSPDVSAWTPYISIEEYRVKWVNTWNPGQHLGSYRYEWQNGTEDSFRDNLGQYGVQVNITKNISVYVNGTDTPIFSQTWQQVNGTDDRLDMWFDNNTVPDGTILKIVVTWSIIVDITNVAYQWGPFTITRTFYTAPINGDVDIDRPIVVLQGNLTQYTLPTDNSITCVALTISRASIERFTSSISWSPVQKITIPLAKNGAYVTSLDTLGTFVYGENVEVTGQFKQISGVWAFNVITVTKSSGFGVSTP